MVIFWCAPTSTVMLRTRFWRAPTSSSPSRSSTPRSAKFSNASSGTLPPSETSVTRASLHGCWGQSRREGAQGVSLPENED